jgi:Ca2+-binding EF-hand superfamily protein
MNPSYYIYEEKLKSFLNNILKEDEYIEKLRKELFSLNNFSSEQLYYKLDNSKKTFINLSDLSSFLSSNNVEYNEFLLRRLIRTYDKRDKFLIVYEDFINIIKPRYQSEFIQKDILRNEEEILIDIILNECNLIEKIGEECLNIRNSKDFTTFEAFMLISKGEKYINLNNLKIFLDKYNIDNSKLEWIIYRIDLDNDKQISYEEFQDLFFPFQSHLKVEELDEKNIFQKEIDHSIKEIDDTNNQIKTLPIDIDNIENDYKDYNKDNNFNLTNEKLSDKNKENILSINIIDNKNVNENINYPYNINQQNNILNNANSIIQNVNNNNEFIDNHGENFDYNIEDNRNKIDYYQNNILINQVDNIQNNILNEHKNDFKNKNENNKTNDFGNNVFENNINQNFSNNYQNNNFDEEIGKNENTINYTHKLMSPENVIVQYDENFNENDDDEINDKFDYNDDNLSEDRRKQDNSDNIDKKEFSLKIKGNLTPQESYRKPVNYLNDNINNLQENNINNNYNNEKSFELNNEYKSYFSERRPYRKQYENLETVTHYELNKNKNNKDNKNILQPIEKLKDTNPQSHNIYSDTYTIFNKNNSYMKKNNEIPILNSKNNIQEDKYLISSLSYNSNLYIQNNLILQLIDFFSDIIEKKSIIESIKENLCLKEDITLDDLFYDFDISRNHEITMNDIIEVCRNFAIFPTNDQIFLLYKKYDKDEDKVLNYDEFCQMILPIKSEYTLIISNRQINPLKNNEISFETKQMIKELIKGLINVETYLYEARARLRTQQTFSCVNAWNLMIEYSKNGNVLDKEEFKLFFDNNGCFYTKFEIEILFNEMDLDKNGKINYKDFASIILNM